MISFRIWYRSTDYFRFNILKEYHDEGSFLFVSDLTVHKVISKKPLRENTIKVCMKLMNQHKVMFST